jgi:Ca2+-binding RTX toxin-like protein
VQVPAGNKRVIGVVAVAFLIGAPVANAGYEVTLDGTEVTMVSDGNHDPGADFPGHVRLLEWDHQSQYQPPREWEVWPATGVDEDLLDGDPAEENCRASGSNLGPEPAMACEDVTLLDVTGSAQTEVVHAGSVEDPDETNHDRDTAVVGDLAGGNDYWNIGDNLIGDHDVAGGAGKDLLELPDSSWDVDLQSNSVTSSDYSVAISGFEDLRLNWAGDAGTNSSAWGTDGANEIEISSGNGTVHGRAGDDSLEVDEGTGNAYGDQGNDGIDVGFFSNPGEQQYAEGGEGDDSIHAWGEDITVAHGGPGNDTIFGFSSDFDGTDTASNSATGGTGNDLVSVSSSATTVGTADGGEGDDTVWGDEGNDMLNGGTGNASGDNVTGFGGNDTIVVDPAASNTSLVGDGSEYVPSGNPPGADKITGSDGIDTINGGGQPDTITARAGNDVIYGDNNTTPEADDPDGGDTINAGAGADFVLSRGGDDKITGGPGDDTINCGDGDDEVLDAEPGDALTNCEVDQLDVVLTSDSVNDGDNLFTVTMTLTNEGETDLDQFAFGYGGTVYNPVVQVGNEGFDPAERATITYLGGPTPAPPTTLAGGESTTHVFNYRIDDEGLAAAYTEATAKDPDDREFSDGHTLVIDTEAEETPDGGLSTGENIAFGSTDHLIMKANLARYRQSLEDAKRIFKIAETVLTPREMKEWFGSEAKIKITNAERALAELYGVAPEYAAAVTMNSKFEGVPGEMEQSKAFFGGMADQAWDNGKKVIKGIGDAGHVAVKGTKDSWNEAVMTMSWLVNQATPEERAQMEAYWGAFFQGRVEDGSLAAPKSQAEINHEQYEQLMYFGISGESLGPLGQEALGNMANNAWQDVTLQSEDLQAQLAQEETKRRDIAKIFEKKPLQAQRELGKATLDEMWPGLMALADMIAGKGVEKVGGFALKKGQGMVRLAKGGGALDESGDVVKGSTKMLPKGPGQTGPTPANYTALALDEAANPVLRENIEELANIGGIPVREAQIQQEIVREIEKEILDEDGVQLDLGIALKNSSALRKENSVAKFELAKVKTGKAKMVQQGMHPDALSEPTLFNPRDPSKAPGWKTMSKAEREAFTAENAELQKSWDDWKTGAPQDPDLAKLRKCTNGPGHPVTEPVEIELSTNRYAKALFEEVPVEGSPGTVRIRVKYYEVDGQVFVNSAEPVPMGPDLDVVAIFDAKAGARIADRATETKVLRKYREKVAARTRAGERFHGAEHGQTLNMNDVKAGPNGHVGFLMQYGLAYLPYELAKKFAERIAPFTEMTAEAMLGQVKQFGQWTVNVTSKDINYGAIPLSSWR